MKRKSRDYKSFDSGGWMNACDSLFLAQFRAKPCEICGATGGWDGKKMPSCGHHLVFKGRCRQHRYNIKNIIVLCPAHHSHYHKECSPHSIVSTEAQHAFYEWVKENKPKQYAWWMEHQADINRVFDKSWNYREMYELLGGEIKKTNGGDALPMSKWKPLRHKPKVDALVALNKENDLG